MKKLFLSIFLLFISAIIYGIYYLIKSNKSYILWYSLAFIIVYLTIGVIVTIILTKYGYFGSSYGSAGGIDGGLTEILCTLIWPFCLTIFLLK